MENIPVDKKVLVCVLGIQQYDDYEDSIEIVAPGRYYVKNDKIYITYKERLQDELEETTTTIKIDGKKVSIMRFGGLNSNMTFELNKKHTTYYDTHQGALVISVLAKHIHVDLKGGEGEMEIIYGLEMNHTAMGMNSFHIKVSSTDEGGHLSLHPYDTDPYPINS